MSEVLTEKAEQSSSELQVDAEAVKKYGQTVFEVLAAPVAETDEGIHSTGPTQQPTYLGGNFMGIDQDRDA